MSSAALLDQDFGSESEDDNFNPAPAEDSENDVAGDSDDDRNVTRKVSSAQGRRRSSAQDIGVDDGEDTTQRPPVNGVNTEQSKGRGSREPKDEEDEVTKQNGGRGLDGAANDDEDEEEQDEDEEEEEEEAISVGIGAVTVVYFSHSLAGSATEASSP